MSKAQSFWDKLWKDKDGHVVIWQQPNLPLWAWIISTVLTKLFKQGRPHQLFMWVAFGALVIWALLEIFKGSNYFRRLVGLIVLAASLFSRLR